MDGSEEVEQLQGDAGRPEEDEDLWSQLLDEDTVVFSFDGDDDLSIDMDQLLLCYIHVTVSLERRKAGFMICCPAPTLDNKRLYRHTARGSLASPQAEAHI